MAGALIRALWKPLRRIARHARGWTIRKAIWATILPLLASGCMTAAPAAVCDGSRLARAEHAAALAQDGGDRSVVTGARLIRLIDVGCADGRK